MRFKKHTWFFLIIGFLVLMMFVYAYTRPIIFKISDGPLPADHRLILFSPFRDREPEKVADRFLDHLRNGECKNIVSNLGWSLEKQELICQKETVAPFVKIRLIDRIDHPSEVTLRYIWYGPGPEHLGSFMKIQVSSKSGHLAVVDYERFY